MKYLKFLFIVLTSCCVLAFSTACLSGGGKNDSTKTTESEENVASESLDYSDGTDKESGSEGESNLESESVWGKDL